MDRNSKICVVDLDDTLIDGQSQYYLIRYLKDKRYIRPMPFLYIIGWFFLYKLGLNLDPRNILEFSLKFLKGMSKNEARQILSDFYDRVLISKVRTELLDIINKHETRIIISNAVEPLVEVISERNNFDDFYSTKLELVDNNYTGKIVGPIVYGSQKVKVIKEISKKHGTNNDITCYADHYSDLPMFMSCKKRVIINPSKRMKKIAEENDFVVLNFIND